LFKSTDQVNVFCLTVKIKKNANINIILIIRIDFLEQSTFTKIQTRWKIHYFTNT